MRSRTILAMFLTALLAGCGSLHVDDPKAAVDADVEEALKLFQQRNAIEYLAAGGKHYVGEGDKASTVDKEVVLPLCERLHKEFKLDPIALVDQDEGGGTSAYEFVVKLPDDAALQESMRAAIREVDARFEGEIYTSWGKKWLDFSFEEPEDLE